MIRLLPIYSYDVGVYQAWLEDQAEKGWLLRRTWGAFFAQFDRVEPMKIRYRLEPKRSGEPEPAWDRQEDCRAMGWDYVWTVMGEFYVWRCRDGTSPEFYTDPQVQGEAYRRTVRRLWISLLLLAAVWIGLGWIVVRRRTGWLFWTLTSPWMGVRLCQIFFWLLVTVQSLIQTVSLTRYARRLKIGLPQPQRRPYRGSKALAYAIFTLWLLMCVFLCRMLFRPDSVPFQPVGSFEEEVPYVPLAVLDPDAPSDGAQAIHDQGLFGADQWWTIEGSDWDTECVTRYYRIRPAFLTGAAARSLAGYAEQEGASLDAMDAPGLDGARTGAYTRSGTQILILWREGALLWISYGGEAPLTDHLADFAALLA